VDKYREGKMKRTPRGGSTAFEIVTGEAIVAGGDDAFVRGPVLLLKKELGVELRGFDFLDNLWLLSLVERECLLREVRRRQFLAWAEEAFTVRQGGFSFLEDVKEPNPSGTEGDLKQHDVWLKGRSRVLQK
jgi:hypothetical protein